MAKADPFTVRYCPNDELYVLVNRKSVRLTEEEERSIAWMWDREGGNLVGAQIMGFTKSWSAKPHALATEIADRFGVPIEQGEAVVARAFKKAAKTVRLAGSR